MIAPVDRAPPPTAAPTISKPAVVAAAGLSCVGALLAWWALGPTLQFLIACLLLMTITAPMLQATGRSMLERAILAQVCCDAIATVWMLVFLLASWGFVAWLLAYLLLLGWNTAITGAAALLRWRIAPAIGVVGGLAVLTWPIWLATWTGPSAERFAGLAATIHPVFAINALLPHLGAWTHQPLSYQLMTLGQDVPFALPSSVWPAAITWLALGLMLWSIAFVRSRSSGGVA